MVSGKRKKIAPDWVLWLSMSVPILLAISSISWGIFGMMEATREGFAYFFGYSIGLTIFYTMILYVASYVPIILAYREIKRK